MLSEISQREKDKYYIISPKCGILKSKTNEGKKTNKQINKHNQIESQSQIQRTDKLLAKGRGEVR